HKYDAVDFAIDDAVRRSEYAQVIGNSYFGEFRNWLARALARFDLNEQIEDFVLGFRRQFKTPLLEHIALQCKQIFLSVGQNNNDHGAGGYVLLALSVWRNAWALVPFPLNRSFSPNARIFSRAISSSF